MSTLSEPVVVDCAKHPITARPNADITGIGVGYFCEITTLTDRCLDKPCLADCSWYSFVPRDRQLLHRLPARLQSIYPAESQAPVSTGIPSRIEPHRLLVPEVETQKSYSTDAQRS